MLKIKKIFKFLVPHFLPLQFMLREKLFPSESKSEYAGRYHILLSFNLPGSKAIRSQPRIIEHPLSTALFTTSASLFPFSTFRCDTPHAKTM